MHDKKLIFHTNKLILIYLDLEPSLELIALSTSDGFDVTSYKREDKNYEADKMAAASSTLCSVSGAVSKQILDKKFDITFIETSSGNIAFVALSLYDKDFVLTMSSGKAMDVTCLRLLIKRFANELSETVKKYSSSSRR